MSNLFIIDIEPLDNRYTKQWRTHFPKVARDALGDIYTVFNIAGTVEYAQPQAGAFFDFAGTCAYKASQAQRIAKMFKDGQVKPNDVFLFTDAWNQTVHTVKYMSELLNIPVKMGGIWHAGWYDPTDILGATIKNKTWAYELERSYYAALDWNWFGTKYNKDLFCRTLNLELDSETETKCFVTGVYPFDWIKDLRNKQPKQNRVVFPHRLNYDKAPHLFDALKEEVQRTHPHIEFIKTQELNLDKKDYYELLKTCKVIFSANKHENLGIGTFESMSAGCLPVLPAKLSYGEIYNDWCLYFIGVDFYDNFDAYKGNIAKMIIDRVENYDQYVPQLNADIDHIQRTYFTGNKMFADIRYDYEKDLV